MNMTKREKILIAAVLILAVLCVYYIYFLQPTLKELDELAAEKTSRELSLSTNAQIQNKVEEISARIADSEKEIERLSGNIKSGFDQPAALVYLSETIEQYAQKVMFFFDPVSSLGQLNACRVTVTMNSTYDGLKSVLDALLEGEYFIKVTGLSASYRVSGDVTGETAPVEPTEADLEAVGPAEDTVSPEPEEDMLSVSLTLEFYNFDGDIPPGKDYPFVGGSSYGGDIFY